MKKLILASLLVITLVVFPLAVPVSAVASESYVINFGLSGMSGPDFLEGIVKYKADQGTIYPYASMQNGAGRDAFLSKLYGSITVEGSAYDIIVKPSNKNLPAEFSVSGPPDAPEWAWNYSLAVDVYFNGEICSGMLWWTVRTIAPDHHVYKIYDGLTFTDGDGVEYEFVGYCGIQEKGK